ncbi:MAG: hypothetical protein HY551_02145, partial [Elusimicrobia bacterium]|nr:hypothetical protein [Elusimicrobiota bacterium]
KFAALFFSLIIGLTLQAQSASGSGSFQTKSLPFVIDDADIAGSRSLKAVDAVRRKLEREAKAGSKVKIFPMAPESPGTPNPKAEPGVVHGRLRLTDPKGGLFAARRAAVLLMQGRTVLAEGRTDAKGRWSLRAPSSASGAAAVRFRLENPFWAVQDPQTEKPYEWEAGSLDLPLPGGRDMGDFRLYPETENGKIGFIHLQFLEALDLFERDHLPLSWWNRRLLVKYPGSADFFSPWEFALNLTRPEAWDVNLHELGHAVMAAGTRSYGGGGRHKIDECYTRGLAWSEGWATFFAGAVRLSPDDDDARFEFLVPRRAPIRIENVPEDVCRGTANEWRVAAGLWDLYDRHGDGQDQIAMAFGTMWSAIQDKVMGGLPDAWAFIRKKLDSRQERIAQAVLRQNTLDTVSTDLLTRRGLPAPSRIIPKSTAKPSWDGAPPRR